MTGRPNAQLTKRSHRPCQEVLQVLADFVQKRPNVVAIFNFVVHAWLDEREEIEQSPCFRRRDVGKVQVGIAVAHA